MKLRGTGALVVALSALILVSCSTGPQPPKVGTPAFYWTAAQETYAAGDYLKAVQHLEGVLRSDNEYTARAYPWYLVLEAGMARGYAELADNFEYGAKENRGNPTPFRRQMNDYRTVASRLSLSFAEAFEKWEKAATDAKVPLAFAFPTGSSFPSAQLQKIASGQMPQPAILEDLRRSHLQTVVLLTATRVVGAPDDTAKTQEIFKGPDAGVPRDVFITEMANFMHDAAKLYTPKKLNDPNRLEYFATHAMDALKPLPETKESKALIANIQKTIKQAKSE